MTFYEQMVPALSILLEIGETLKAPIYGTLLQKKRNYTFGYLGLSESALLVSLLQGDSKKLKGSSRIPFSNIQKTKVRKSLFPLQYILKIYLTDGDMIKFRISKKDLWIYYTGRKSGHLPEQNENLYITRNINSRNAD